MRIATTTCLAAAVLLVLSCNAHDIDETLEWKILDVRLPTGLSDHTATVGSSDGLVYIAGGCNSADTLNETLGQFVCTSLSDSLFSFDPKTETFVDLPDLVRGRYRHAAAIVGDKLWLAGGRDLDDNIISEIDVYDISTGTWSTVGVLPPYYEVSDLDGIGTDQYAYFAGGYLLNYTAVPTCVRFDSNQTITNGTINFEQVPSMATARGDAMSAFDDGLQYWYTIGGFTDANGFCKPLSTVERYSVDGDGTQQNTWESVEPLKAARGDGASVSFANGVIIVLGGETRPADFCTNSSAFPPEEQSVLVDEVEEFESETWHTVGTLERHRFRFAAVGFEKAVYSFGGQNAYNSSCNCFPTTSEIVVYYLEKEQEPSAAYAAFCLWSTWLIFTVGVPIVLNMLL